MTAANEVAEGEKLPVIFEHSCTVYDAMYDKASKLEPTHVVYQGFPTRLIVGELNFSSPMYSAIMNCLKSMGCIVQLKRGGGGSESSWRLVRRPTEEKFLEVREPGKRSGKPGVASAYEGLKDDNVRMQQRISDLEETVDKLGKAVFKLGSKLNSMQMLQPKEEEAKDVNLDV